MILVHRWLVGQALQYVSSSLYSSALLIKASAFASSPATTPYQQVFVSSDRTMNPIAPKSKLAIACFSLTTADSDSELRLDALQWLFLQRLAALKCHLTRWAGKCLHQFMLPLKAREMLHRQPAFFHVPESLKTAEHHWVSQMIGGQATRQQIPLLYVSRSSSWIECLNSFFCFARLELQFT